MTLRDDLFILAPELLTNDVDALARADQFLVWAALRVNRCVYGEAKADLATILLAAHMLSRFNENMNASSPGQVTSEKIGDISQNYGVIQMPVGAEEFGTTTYGAQFYSMQRAVLTSPLVV